MSHLLVYLFIFPTFFSCFCFTQTLNTRMLEHQGMPKEGMYVAEQEVHSLETA